MILRLWVIFLLLLHIVISLQQNVEHPKIAIIGAGMAGLSAGRRLRELGIPYTIYEGADRVGGRIHSIPYKGGFLQMGAQFINGETNPLYIIASKLNLIDGELSDLAHFTDSKYLSGKCPIKKEHFDEFMQFIDPLDLKYRTLALENEKKSYSHTMKMLYDEDYSEFIKKNNVTGERRQLFDALSRPYRSYWEFEWASDWSDQSLRNLADWDDLGEIGVSYTTNRIGYKGIIDHMASYTPKEWINFNHQIENIDYSGEKIKLQVKGGIEIEDQYDYVMVTVSLGHLKKYHNSLFTPPLGNYKRKLIKNIGFGGSCKVFFRWDEPWWSPDTHSIAPLPIQGCEGREGQLDPFEEELTTLQTVPWEPNTLMGWIAGRGHKLFDSLSDEEFKEKTTQLVRYTTGNYSISPPAEIIRTKLTQNELLLGSYSYVSKAQAALRLKHADLAIPVRNNGKIKLLFAGEATHYRMFETAVGAYQSGRREVDRLMDDWRNRQR